MSAAFNPNQSQNQQIRDIQEIAIAVSAKDLKPAMLSEDFLKLSGVIPNDWELARQPIANPRLTQMVFKNGVGILAQARTFAFTEALGSKNPADLKAPDVARKYVQKLPNAEYQSLSVSPKSLIPFPGSKDAARKYITQTLMAPGPWQQIGQAPLRAGLNFVYQLQQCQLTINISEAGLQTPDKSVIPAVLFSGSFNYPIASQNEQERVIQIEQRINNWQQDWEMFQELVKEKLLQRPSQQDTSVFPDGML